MKNMSNIDLQTATLEDLDNLSFDEILGRDLSDYNLSSNLPDGTYLMFIEKRDGKSHAADPTKNKAARKDLSLTFRVHTCLQCADPEIDAASLANRVHIERYNVLQDFGIANLIKLILGVVGVSFRDKEAQKQVGGAPIALIDQLIAGKVIFGVQVKTVERGGYENCNIQTKEQAFISMDKAVEYVG